MRLTWRDAITTLLVIAVVVVYYAYVNGTDLPIIDDVRGALLVMGAAGLGTCIVGGSSGYVGRNSYTTLMSILGIVAFAVIAFGLITAAEWTLTVLGIDIVLMWGAALLYRLFFAPAQRTGPNPI